MTRTTLDESGIFLDMDAFIEMSDDEIREYFTRENFMHMFHECVESDEELNDLANEAIMIQKSEKDARRQHVHGRCPTCSYELDDENSEASINASDTEQYKHDTLLAYHYDASPGCHPRHSRRPRDD